MPKTIYAVIIGINAYPRNPLFGCVNDALDVHEFCGQLASANEDIGDYQPKFLLAPHPEDRGALQGHGLTSGDYDSPTRNNIIQAFNHFKQAKAEEGDICLLYYSGHGSFQGAPEIFWDLKSGKQVESIVCVDSRVPGGRDLIDKEMAYLLWNATHDKTSFKQDEASIHTLMIMDCCHSGDNTRGESVVRNRMETPNPTQTSIKDYQGYKETIGKGKSSAAESQKRFLAGLEKWRSARYVHLAAARDTETAKETMLEDRSSGIFTYSLLKTLRNGGMQLSYEELIERVKVMVRNRVDEQLPLLFSTAPEDSQLTFMGGGLKEPVKEYLVSYHEESGTWVLHAGANAGIVASDPSFGKTTVHVWRKGQEGEGFEMEVQSVGSSESILDGSGLTTQDQQHEDWVARITHMSVPTIKVYLDESVTAEARKKLQEEEPSDEVATYEFVEEKTDAAFIIYSISKEYVMTKKDSNVPVFRRSGNAKVFLTALQSVGQWLRVLELDNPETTIVRDDIDVQVEVIEGVTLRLNNLNTVAASKEADNPATIKADYKRAKGNASKQIQPGLRVRLKTTNRPYFISCLYMDSQYGITSNLGSTEILPDGSGEWLKFSNKGIEYRTIPLSFDDNYHKLGVTEVTDYLKIFVSTQEFPVKGWEQNELELDDKLVEITRSGVTKRGMSLDEDEEFDNTGDWTSFTIPIKIKRPLLAQEQAVNGDGDKEANVGGAKVTVPKGFSATVSAASAAEVKEMVEEVTTRSANEGNALRKTLLPPAIIWGSTPSSSAIFTRGVSAADSDAQLSVLELNGAAGSDLVSAENPLVFEPEGGVGEDEVLISFGYDPDSGMYLPLGLSDDEGRVQIEQLPKETPGKIIGEEAITERSLKGSIKLFFKKVVLGRITGLTNNNSLCICSCGDDGLSVATPVADGALEGVQNICLLIHGIIGDTLAQRQCFFENESELYKKFDVVITYDYENLNTPIEETAKLLKADLAKAGVTDAGGKRITIVAHSMGGLVSRWFIEHEGGSEVVKRLIQMGTPNGGSETSDFRKSVFGMMSTAMNGAVFMQPYLPVLSFIGKHVGKALFKTLNQMSPTESEFLKTLNAEGSPHPGVNYSIIGGDTSQIKPKDLEGLPMLKQFWKAIKTRAPYEILNKVVFKSTDPNDMAVTQVSMQTVATQSDLPFYSVGCDHVSYFVFDDSVKKLEELLNEEN